MIPYAHDPRRHHPGLRREGRDARINARFGYQSDTLARWYELLCKQGEVEVGWRECCGARSVTAYAYTEWRKVIKRLERAHGIKVTVERVKHKNAYASNNGGFWNSEIFRLPQAG